MFQKYFVLSDANRCWCSFRLIRGAWALSLRGVTRKGFLLTTWMDFQVERWPFDNFKFWELRWRNVWKTVCTIDICIVKVSTELCLCLYVFQNLALSCQISRWLLCNLWCSCFPEFVSFHLGTFPSPKGERLFLRLIIIKYNFLWRKECHKAPPEIS